MLKKGQRVKVELPKEDFTISRWMRKNFNGRVGRIKEIRRCAHYTANTYTLIGFVGNQKQPVTFLEQWLIPLDVEREDGI